MKTEQKVYLNVAKTLQRRIGDTILSTQDKWLEKSLGYIFCTEKFLTYIINKNKLNFIAVKILELKKILAGCFPNSRKNNTIIIIITILFLKLYIEKMKTTSKYFPL